MKDGDIREQIEDELKDKFPVTFTAQEYRYLIDQLIESRKTIRLAEERIQAKDSVIKLLQEQLKILINKNLEVNE
jgi:hypothetical protein